MIPAKGHAVTGRQKGVALIVVVVLLGALAIFLAWDQTRATGPVGYDDSIRHLNEWQDDNRDAVPDACGAMVLQYGATAAEIAEGMGNLDADAVRDWRHDHCTGPTLDELREQQDEQP